MNARQTRRQRAALEQAIAMEINRLEVCRELLHRVDDGVLEAGAGCFGSDADFAIWLCAPAQALGSQIPLRAMRTAAGRQKVTSILRAIEGGVFL